MNEEIKPKADETEKNQKLFEENLAKNRLDSQRFTIATDSEFKLPLFVKRAGVTPLSHVWLITLYEMKNPDSFQG